MANVTLLIPLQLPQQHGFFNPDGTPQATLLGFPVGLRLQSPYCYLELRDVPDARAGETLKQVRNCLKWAAVRLDMGMSTDREPLRQATAAISDGQFATAYPADIEPNPIRVAGSHRGEEPSNRLFAALNEGSVTAGIAKPTKQSTLLACEFFAATDFEITANAKFLMLSTVLEVLADPKPRPALCIYLVEELLKKIREAEAIAKRDRDKDAAEALEGLRNSAAHYEKESITSSVRKLAAKAARVLGDPDPEKAGKEAAALYGKRSNLVHSGESVTWADVAQLRQVAREALAVEVECYDRIRERFPA
jgi:hypothetical protein